MEKGNRWFEADQLDVVTNDIKLSHFSVNAPFNALIPGN